MKIIIITIIIIIIIIIIVKYLQYIVLCSLYMLPLINKIAP